MTGRRPKKAILNIIRLKDYKKKTEEREAKLWSRVHINKTPAQLNDTLLQFDFRMKQIKQALEIGFPAFYQNGPDACKQYFTQCEYFPLCQAQDADLIQMLMYGNYIQREWSPYEIEGIKDKNLVDLGF
jgi:hypothetical protein